MKQCYVFPPPDATDATLVHDQGWTANSRPGTHPSGRQGFVFDIPDGTPNGNGAEVTFLKNGRTIISLRGVLYLTNPTGVGLEVDDFTKVKMGAAIRPFRLDGHFCRYIDDGTEMLINHTTGFRLFGRWRAGDAKADAFAQSCIDNQFNMLRVSGLQDTSLYLSDPNLQYRIFPEGPQYYKDLSDFYDWLSGYGLYMDFVCFMQTTTLMPDKNAQIAHLTQCFQVLQDKYALVSKVNEQYQHDNSIEDATRLLPKPAGATFLLSQGSKGAGDESPLTPVADTIEYHGNDLSEWWRKGHNPWEMGNNNGGAGYVSEDTRTDSEVARVGDASAQIHYEDDAATQIGMLLSAHIHTSEGKNADPFGFSLPYIAAHNRGIVAALGRDALNQRRGDYIRYTNPDVLREYSMGTNRWDVRF